MIKRSFLIFFLLLIVLVFILFKTTKNDSDRMLKVESVPIYNSAGWGYNILVDHKIFIHQEYIPAIMGKKEFCSKEDAMKTAGLVIEKLKRKKQPTITKDDLTALKITL